MLDSRFKRKCKRVSKYLSKVTDGYVTIDCEYSSCSYTAFDTRETNRLVLYVADRINHKPFSNINELINFCNKEFKDVESYKRITNF